MQIDLIDGITVLNSRVVDITAQVVILWILVIMAMALAVYIIVDAVKDRTYGMIWYSILPLYVGMLTIVLIRNFGDIKSTEYEVLIDNKTALIEVYENYEIDSVDGLIYTIREKENKE